ncbi:MAG TPA: cytochrome c oxidase assembly protein [Terracidiphilus sp.]|nr:cytochrome c oxidase assembly protein [Terracidiphilus sp.]
MSPAVQSVLEDWSLPVPLTTLTVLTCVVYVRGWLALRRTRPQQFDGMRLTWFLSGMASLWFAIGSPMDAFADVLLSAHMVEHLILMSVVPPLVLMGQPVVPLLRGLPRFLRKGVAGPLIRFRPLRSFFHWLVRPTVAWLALNIALLGWHVPAAYDLALENETVHDIEHLCFLIGSMLFWWCLIRPWPAARRQHDWSILLFLVTADGVNTALSAFLAFCSRPVYTYYVDHPNPFHIAPLPDQVLGAVIMWVVGSIAFLLPAFALTLRFLQPSRPRRIYTGA